MSKIRSIVLCVALVVPTLLGGCAAPLVMQALGGMTGMTGQSTPFSFSALSKQLDGMMPKGDVAQAPQAAAAPQ